MKHLQRDLEHLKKEILIVGSLVEQAPYLEMQNSSSSNSSCQNCHLPPRADDESGISTYIARDPSSRRAVHVTNGHVHDIALVPERIHRLGENDLHG